MTAAPLRFHFLMICFLSHSFFLNVCRISQPHLISFNTHVHLFFPPPFQFFHFSTLYDSAFPSLFPISRIAFLSLLKIFRYFILLTFFFHTPNHLIFLGSPLHHTAHSLTPFHPFLLPHAHPATTPPLPLLMLELSSFSSLTQHDLPRPPPPLRFSLPSRSSHPTASFLPQLPSQPHSTPTIFRHGFLAPLIHPIPFLQLLSSSLHYFHHSIFIHSLLHLSFPSLYAFPRSWPSKYHPFLTFFFILSALPSTMHPPFACLSRHVARLMVARLMEARSGWGRESSHTYG